MTALLYPGCINAIAAEPAQGKTWLALHAAAQLLRRDQAVVYLDYEGNRRIVGSRLRALGVTPAEAERFAYIRPGIVGAAERAALVELVGELGAGLVVIDGVAKSLAKQGLSEDKAPDVLAWMDLLCWPLTEAGPGLLLLDHVVKDKEHQGRWARGSSAKLGEIDGASYTLRGKGFSREKAGKVRMVVTKDREGAVGAEGETAAVAHFEPHGDGLLTVRLERPEHTDDTDHQRFVPTECMGKIEAYLRAHPGQWYSKEAITEGVRPMRKETALLAIDELVRTGVVHIDTEQRWPRYGVPVPLEEPEPSPVEDVELDF